MSERSYWMFIQPKDEAKLSDINDLVASSASNTLNDLEQSDESGVLKLTFYTGTSFDIEMFLEQLLSSGAGDIETAEFSTQTGEYSYYKNTKYCESYRDAEWNWLKNREPDFDFEDQYIVLTGEFDDYLEDLCIDDIEAILEDHGGVIEEIVTEKTTMLITGESPDLNEITHAKKLAVEIMTGKDFEKIVNDAYDEVEDD